MTFSLFEYYSCCQVHALGFIVTCISNLRNAHVTQMRYNVNVTHNEMKSLFIRILIIKNDNFQNKSEKKVFTSKPRDK